MISSTQLPTANTGFSAFPPASISYSVRSSCGTSVPRWCAIRASVPSSESAARIPAAASTSASSAESPVGDVAGAGGAGTVRAVTCG